MKHPFLIAIAVAVLACEAKPQAAPQAKTARPTIAAATSGATPAPPAADGPNVAAGVHFIVRYSGDANPDATAPMVIAIHGLGDSPDNFSGLLAKLDDPARIIYPRGLSPYRRGFSWFSRGAQRTEEIRVAADKLAAMITALSQRFPTRGKPVVTGFSQGGMLSYALAVRHGHLVNTAVPIAGALPTELVPLRASNDAPPIFALHGDADPVLAIAPTRELTRILRERGFDADLTEYPDVLHTVSPAMHRALMRRLREAIAQP